MVSYNIFSVFMLAIVMFVAEGKACYLSVYSATDGCMKWIITGDMSKCSDFSVGGYQSSVDLSKKVRFDDSFIKSITGTKIKSGEVTDSAKTVFENLHEDAVSSDYSSVVGTSYSPTSETESTISDMPETTTSRDSSLSSDIGISVYATLETDNASSHSEYLTEDTSSSGSSFSSDMGTRPHSTWETGSLTSNFKSLTEGTTSNSFSFSDNGTSVYPTPETGSTLDLCPGNLQHLLCTCELLLLSNGTGMCTCSEAAGGFSSYEGSTCMWLPRDCDEIQQNGVSQDGIYTIYPSGNDNLPFNVYCLLTEEGGWTVIQRRSNGILKFQQDLENYVRGFGNLNEEFWLGNEKLFHLTNQSTCKLRIDMVLDGGRKTFAEYDAFKINDATDDFRLVSLGSYNGSTGGFDAMALSLNMGFTTIDHDVDVSSHNCASTSGGGWWYNGGGTGWCYHANLNGIYGDQRNQPAIIWYIGSGFEYEYLVKSVEMKIRPT